MYIKNSWITWQKHSNFYQAVKTTQKFNTYIGKNSDLMHTWSTYIYHDSIDIVSARAAHKVWHKRITYENIPKTYSLIKNNTRSYHTVIWMKGE